METGKEFNKIKMESRNIIIPLIPVNRQPNCDVYQTIKIIGYL